MESSRSTSRSTKCVSEWRACIDRESVRVSCTALSAFRLALVPVFVQRIVFTLQLPPCAARAHPSAATFTRPSWTSAGSNPPSQLPRACLSAGSIPHAARPLLAYPHVVVHCLIVSPCNRASTTASCKVRDSARILVAARRHDRRGRACGKVRRGASMDSVRPGIEQKPGIASCASLISLASLGERLALLQKLDVTPWAPGGVLRRSACVSLPDQALHVHL